MEQTLTLPQTHIGKKAIMAVSGVALVGFVVAHLLGNLQVFLGPEVMNEYAASLRKIPAILWGMRIGLLLAVIAHVLSAVALVSANAEARPVGYAKVKHQKSTYASRTMRWGGPIILLYIIYHLLHLTFGFGFDADHPYTPHN
ncbi:MAG: succinate dehydrogenase cytochrome b subunit, partial [Myxococcales bacterium]|nr:succinate dehydrogenase cytochrome b subunit [Myxococcales bacterium]